MACGKAAVLAGVKRRSAAQLGQLMAGADAREADPPRRDDEVHLSRQGSIRKASA
jgi:hypothetical protein